jgi:hypothetical protein
VRQRNLATCRRAFEEFKREAPYTTSNVTLFSAVAAHYIQDAHQPLHATDNYDGQQTGNAGIHSRFERDLIERYESRLKLTPAPVKPMGSARDAAFEALLASYLLVDPLLKADKEAIGSGDTYDDAYFEKFFHHGAAAARAAAVRRHHRHGQHDRQRLGPGRPTDGPAHRRAAATKSPFAPMTVYLLSVGRDRFELYSEPPDKPASRRDRTPGASVTGRTPPMCGGMRSSNRRGSAHPPGASRSGETPPCAGWRKPLPNNERCGRSRSSARPSCCFRHRSVNRKPARRSIALGAAARPPSRLVDGRGCPVVRGLRAGGADPRAELLAYYLGFRLIGHWLSWRGRASCGNVPYNGRSHRTAISPNSPRS